MIEAVEHSNGTRYVPIQPPAGVADPAGQARAARHSRKEVHISRVGSERIGLIEPLPTAEPEQLVFYDSPACIESDLMAMEWRITLILAVSVEDPSARLQGRRVLILTKIEDAAVDLVSSALGDNVDR